MDKQNEILQPLIDKANEANIKPKNNGNSILFQRDVDPPSTEPLEDELDDIEDKNNLPIDNEDSYYESNEQDTEYTLPENSTNNGDNVNKPKFSRNSSKNTYKPDDQSSEEEEEFIESELKAHRSPPENEKQINISNDRKNPKSWHIFSRNKKRSASLTPKNPKPSSMPPSKSSRSSSIKRNSKIATNYKHDSSYTSSMFSTLFYLVIVVAVFIGIISNAKETEDTSLLNNTLELDAVTRLNDCIKPLNSISGANYSISFLNYIKNGSSIYLRYDEETQSIVINKTYQSVFCKAVSFGDRHPDLCGLFIAWIIIFFYYIHYRISRTRAERIAPEVMRLLQSKQMCYQDEAKKKMKEKGHCLFGAWWQVKSIIGHNNNVKTVKMIDSDPFWSLSNTDN